MDNSRIGKKFCILFMVLLSLAIFAFGVFFAFGAFSNKNSIEHIEITNSISEENSNNFSFSNQTFQTVGVSEDEPEKVEEGWPGVYSVSFLSKGFGYSYLEAYNDSRGWVRINSGGSESWLRSGEEISIRVVVPSVDYECNKIVLKDKKGLTNIFGITSFTGYGNCEVEAYIALNVETYSITYYNDDLPGCGYNSNPTSYNSNESVTINAISRTGYTFLGWTGSNGSSPQTTVTIPRNSSGDKSYTANWEALRYTIYLDKNGGSGGQSSVSNVYYGETVPNINSLPSRTGYDFLGYKYNGSYYFDSSGYSGRNYAFTYNITCEAQWEAKDYYITLNHNGGTSSTSGVSITYGDNVSYKSVNVPTKTGYTFLGYYYNSTLYFGSNGAGQNITYYYTNDITVSAKWEIKKFDITLAKDLGVNLFDYSIKGVWTTKNEGGTIKNVEALSSIEIVINGIKDGFIWSNYVISGTADVDYEITSGSIYDQHLYIKVFNSITITAKTQIKFGVYSCNNGTGKYLQNANGGSVKVINGVYGASAETGVVQGNSVSFYAKSNFACRFLGFYSGFNADGGTGTQYEAIETENNGEYVATISNITSAINVYAIFEFIKNDLNAYAYSSLTSTFANEPDSIGGTVLVAGGSAGASSNFRIGYTILTNVIAQPKEGYIFIGWYDSLKTLQDDTANENMWSANANYEFHMENKTTSYYAKFMKLYTLTLKNTTGVVGFTIEGVDNLTAVEGGYSANYYFGQSIGDITVQIDDVRYVWKEWKITSEKAPNLVSEQLLGMVIKSIKMQDYNFVLTAYTTPQKFDLNVYAIYTDNGSLVKDTSKGGTIQIDNSTPDAFDTKKVTYGTNEASITASQATGYTFLGWFKEIDLATNSYSSPFYPDSDNRIETMDIYGLNYYAIFIKNYNLYIYYDSGIQNVQLSNSVLETAGDGTNYYEATFYFNQKIDVLSVQTLYGYKWAIWVVGENNFLPENFDVNAMNPSSYASLYMCASDCTLTATTTSSEFDLIVRTCYADTNDYIYDQTVGGTVKISDGDAGGSDKVKIKFQTTTSITATVNPGYTFWGWYKIEDGSTITSKTSNYFSSSPQVITAKMQYSVNGTTYIALFIKEYTVNIIAGDGVVSVSKTETENGIFYYGDTCTIGAIFPDSYRLKWVFSANSAIPDGFNYTQPNQYFSVNGNIEITATTTISGYTLTIIPKTKSPSGQLNSEKVGGGVKLNGEILPISNNKIVISDISSGFNIYNLIYANEGFKFDWFYDNEQCTNTYNVKGSKTLGMPSNDLTLYAKFDRLLYELTLGYFDTDEIDNETKIKGKDDNFSSNQVNSVVYGGTTGLIAKAELGFILQGVYFDENCTKVAISTKLNYYSQGLDKIYEFNSPTMDIGGMSLYALFVRESYVITVDKSHDAISIDINSSDNKTPIIKGYFGEQITFDAKLGPGLSNLSIEIYKTNNTLKEVSFEENTFKMPNYGITFYASAVISNIDIIFDANGGDFSGYYQNVEGKIFGQVPYNSNEYIYYTNLNKTLSTNGVPLPTRTGFVFKGYNTNSTGDGTTYISYNNGVFSYNVCDISEETALLYAMWQIETPDISIEYSSESSTIYNGEYQNALKVIVENKSPDLIYTYEWKKDGSSEVFGTSEILSLRSVSQSGDYYCIVSTEKNNSLSQSSSSLNFTITKRNLELNIGDLVYYGTKSFVVEKDNITNFLGSLHNIVNCELTFNADTNDIRYSESENKDRILYNLVVSLKNDISITEQDGSSLSSNYSYSLVGSATIKTLQDTIILSVGGYERTINQTTFGNVFSEEALNDVQLGITYSPNFETLTTNESGVLQNYISKSNVGGTLAITIISTPTNYDLFSLIKINSQNYTNFSIDGNVITLTITQTLITENSLCDIKVYFTKQCLVNLEYNFVDGEVENDFASYETAQIIQEKGSLFVSPSSTSFSREGLAFNDWYYDENLNIPVSSTWTKTGETTIFAKWNMLDLTADKLTLITKDNNIKVDNVYRAYNGNKVDISVEYVNPYINLNVNWFKKLNNNWKNPNKTNVLSLKNVSDTGIYSFSAVASFGSEIKTFEVGLILKNIDIYEKEITISEEITKIYDATTVIPSIYINTGINFEQVKILGEFASSDVKIQNNVIQKIALTNLSFEAGANTLLENYVLANTNYYGKILPYEVSIIENQSRVYNGEVFEYTSTKTINHTANIHHIINYIVKTSGSDAGVYSGSDLSLVYSVSDGIDTISNNNYKLNLGSTSQLTINKTNITAFYNNKEVYFNNTKQMNLISFTNANPNDESLPFGATRVNYTYNGSATTGFVDAGSYTLTAEIIGDKNHNNLTLTAELKIKPAKYSVKFSFNNSDMPKSYEYSNEDINNLIYVVAKNMNDGTVVPSIRKKVLFNNLETTTIIEVGTYTITYELRTPSTNFELVGDDSVYLTITPKVIKDNIDILFQNNSSVYNGQNQATDFVDTATMPSFVDIASQSIKVQKNDVYQNISTAKDVGVYVFTLNLQLNDSTHYTLENPTIIATLEITPFEITSDNSQVSATKQYNAKTNLQNATIVIDLGNSNSEILNLTGTYADSNVNSSIKINDAQIVNMGESLATNFTGLNFEIYGEITQREMTINLTENGGYLCQRYTSNLEYILTKTQNNKFISPKLEEEYFVITFKGTELNSNSTNFELVKQASLNNYLLITDLKVYNSTNDIEIVNGKNNYDFKNLLGGITFLQNLAVVEIVDTDLTYSGTVKQIKLKISTEDEDIIYTVNSTNTIELQTNFYSEIDSYNTAIPNIKDAGKYKLKIVDNRLEHFVFQNSSNEVLLAFEILKADLELDFGEFVIDYKDNFAKEVSFDGVGTDSFTDTLTYFESTENYNVGEYKINPSTANLANDYGNYNINFEGTLKIRPKQINIIANYSNLNLIYNAKNQILSLEEVEVNYTDKNNNAISVDPLQITRKYFRESDEINQIINAGEYFVKFISTNYIFIDDTEFVNFVDFNFEINKRDITTTFNITENLVYNTQNQTPVLVYFENVCDGDNLNSQITYSNGENSIKNAGNYTATIAINNDNYNITNSITSEEFTVKKYEIELATPSEIIFSKNFGESDPELIQTISPLGENVDIIYQRESGENVGTYSLLNPIISNDNQVVKNNYSVKSGFVDSFNAFEIVALTGIDGTLTLELLGNITATYNALQITNILLDNINSELYVVKNHLGEVLTADEYDLSAILNFNGKTVKNCGEYAITLQNSTSTTHKSNLIFNSNNYKYIIEQKEISLSGSGENITKIYDKTSVVDFNSSLQIAENQIFAGDVVSLAGNYIENNREVSNVGTNFAIILKLTGDSANNYKINSNTSDYFGAITVREITVVPINSSDLTAFDKIYDATNLVDTTKLTLENVVGGDNVEFVGAYEQITVGTNIEIAFDTENPNYKIVGNYSGSITPRELTLADSSFVKKSFDGTTSLDITKLTLNGVLNDDEITIVSANFENSNIGAQLVNIVLGGSDKDNYFIAQQNGEIVERLITINYHYGDDEIYTFDFVEDNEEITNKVNENLVIYGTSLNDSKNGEKSLPIPTRKGYTFEKWYTSQEFLTEFNANIILNAENNFDINSLKTNDYVLDLYANWNIKTYNLNIKLFTEQIDNSNYILSTEGGKFVLDSVENTLSEFSTTLNYYSNHPIEITANDGFSISEIKQNDAVVRSLTQFGSVEQDCSVEIKFARSLHTIFIQFESDAQGFDNTWTIENNTASRILKHNSQIVLPILTKIGKDFNGYKISENETISYSESLGFDITINEDKNLKTDFSFKTLKVYFDFNGGTLKEPYTFESTTEKYIFVEYNSAFGELPILKKSGYLHNSFALYNGKQKVFDEINSASILLTDSDSLILVATWLENDNKFEISKQLDTAKYAGNDYQVFETNVSLYYSKDNNNYELYTNSFNAKTNSQVSFKYVIDNFAYKVVGWKVNGTLLNGGQTILYNVKYFASGTYLNITNFGWEEDAPEIVLVFEPALVEISTQIINGTYANINYGPAIFDENEIKQTYAGTILSINLGTKDGYELDSFEVVNANGVIENDILTVNSIIKDFSITLNFEIKSYALNFVINGEPQSVSILYEINGGEEQVATNSINIRTNDNVIIKAVVLFGYALNDSWSITGGGSPTLTNISTTTENNQTIVVKQLEDFTETLTLTISSHKLSYNVSASKKFLQDEEYIEDTTSNTASVLNSLNSPITNGEFNLNVVFKASIEKDTFTAGTNTVIQNKYDFVGWFYYENLEYYKVSEELTLNTIITGEMNYIAIFTNRTFNVKFLTENSDKGTVQSTDGTNAISSQNVVYGSAISTSVKAVAKSGYQFEKWNITYNYTSVVETEIRNSTLTSSEIDNVKCDITCTAIFKQFEITVNVSSEFDDGSALDSEKINISGENHSGLAFSFNTLSHKDINLKATAQQGYAFKEWQIETDTNSYTVNINSTSSLVKNDITIQFIGTETTYNIKAIFEKATNNIEVKITLEDGSKIEGGVVCNEENSYTGARMVYTAKTESTLTAYVKIYNGYRVNTDVAGWYETSINNLYINFNDLTETLTENEQRLFSKYITFTISGFKSDFTLQVNATRQETKLILFERNFLATTQAEKFVQTDYTATVYYGNSIIDISNPNLLCPVVESYEFMGWSLNIYGTTKIINSYGSLINSIWTMLDNTLNIYPIFELRKVKIDVKVVPNSAQTNESINSELFNNIVFDNPTSVPIIINNDYYFYTGASFNLTLPTTNAGYTFCKYKYLLINELNQIVWEEIKVDAPEMSEYISSGMFKIKKYSDFTYSSASNKADFEDYLDGVMYIELIYGINYSTEIENLFNQNRISVIGGTVSVNNAENSNYALYREELEISATLEDGYEIDAWFVNGVKLNHTNVSFNYIITEPTTIKCVLKGKQVMVGFGESNFGKGTGITGGNGFNAGNLTYYFRVGDIIIMSAQSNVGYDFINAWYHSNGTTYEGAYIISSEDAENNNITFTPLFEARQITVLFNMINSEGGITKNDVDISKNESGTNTLYSFSQAYINEIIVNIIANQKYSLLSIEFFIDNIQQEFLSTYLKTGNVLTIPTDKFCDGKEFVFKVYFQEIYWYDYLLQNGIISIGQDDEIIIENCFSGTGKQDDPYKLESSEDIALLAFIINNNIMQTNINKYGFNSSLTHYVISRTLNLEARFWTPIGTLENPFNANMVIYNKPINLIVDKDDESYIYDNFNLDTLKQYGNIFGAVSDTANIEFKVMSNSSLIIVLSIIFGLIFILILILVIIAIKRKKQVEDFDENNRKI